ncbi:unnamed protein product [Durusdinium trenchii]|uniref:Uncharacterized protein n=1 Tax=Durusdinium trenchii TaxID=1381693 RepID=A0ABP0N043_9DINO
MDMRDLYNTLGPLGIRGMLVGKPFNNVQQTCSGSTFVPRFLLLLLLVLLIGVDLPDGQLGRLKELFLLKSECFGPSEFNQLPTVKSVDIFICHSWSCSSWIKILALCHYLHLDWAVTAASFVTLLAVFTLVVCAGSFHEVSEAGEMVLSGAFVWGPAAIFFSVYFFGHLLRSKALWFDRICVNQVDLALKAQTIQGIPAFVSQAARMVLLCFQNVDLCKLQLGALWVPRTMPSSMVALKGVTKPLPQQNALRLPMLFLPPTEPRFL